MAQAPLFERMLVDSGISLTKFWFSVTQAEQRTRFIIRQVDPVRQWKLSPIDLESLDKWDDYTEAKEAMIRRTDTEWAPWTTIKSNDKKRARINAMRALPVAASTTRARTPTSSASRTRDRPARHRRGRRLSPDLPGEVRRLAMTNPPLRAWGLARGRGGGHMERRVRIAHAIRVGSAPLPGKR